MYHYLLQLLRIASVITVHLLIKMLALLGERT